MPSTGRVGFNIRVKWTGFSVCGPTASLWGPCFLLPNMQRTTQRSAVRHSNERESIWHIQHFFTVLWFSGMQYFCIACSQLAIGLFRLLGETIGTEEVSFCLSGLHFWSDELVWSKFRILIYLGNFLLLGRNSSSSTFHVTWTPICIYQDMSFAQSQSLQRFQGS